jgi:hypothetical protein
MGKLDLRTGDGGKGVGSMQAIPLNRPSAASWQTESVPSLTGFWPA